MRSPFQDNERSYRLTDWCAFWLLANDVLRLSKFRSDANDILTSTEKDELPIESIVKLTLFEGEFARYSEEGEPNRSSSDSPMDRKRAKQWDLSGSAMQLNHAMDDVSNFGELF